MKIKTSFIIVQLLYLLFILLFSYAAMSKFIDHSNFQDQLIFATGHNLSGKVLSYLIPAAELMIAGMLCFQRTKLAGLYMFTIVMCCFSVYIGYLMLSGRHLPCTCGGVISAMTWKQHLIFNLSFMIAGIASIIFYTSKPAPANLNSITTSF